MMIVAMAALVAVVKVVLLAGKESTSLISYWVRPGVVVDSAGRCTEGAAPPSAGKH